MVVDARAEIKGGGEPMPVTGFLSLVLLPAHDELLITYQKSPDDELCFIRWAGSSKSAEVLGRKMQLMPMGQYCSNQALLQRSLSDTLACLVSI